MNPDTEQDKSRQKEAVNLSLDSELVEKVEDVIFNLRKRLPREKRKKLNRSRFFELALNAVIMDYENDNDNSVIYKAVILSDELSS